MKILSVFFLLIGIWLLAIPSPSQADTYNVIPPVSVGANGLHTPPDCDPKNSEDKCAQNYSNDAENGLKCSFKATVSQRFEPEEVVPTQGVYPAPSGSPSGPYYEPYDVNRIDEEKTPDDLTNSGFRSSAIHFAKSPPFDPSQTDQDRLRQCLSYGYEC